MATMVGWKTAMTTEERHTAMTAGFERSGALLAAVRAEMKTEVATLRDEVKGEFGNDHERQLQAIERRR